MHALLTKFWADDRGALLAAEWLCLAGLTVLGVAAGAGTVRNTISAEFDAFNRSLATLSNSEAYAATAPSTGATTSGSGATVLPRLTGGDLPIF